jgi:hypothetical protein
MYGCDTASTDCFLLGSDLFKYEAHGFLQLLVSFSQLRTVIQPPKLYSGSSGYEVPVKRFNIVKILQRKALQKTSQSMHLKTSFVVFYSLISTQEGDKIHNTIRLEPLMLSKPTNALEFSQEVQKSKH